MNDKYLQNKILKSVLLMIYDAIAINIAAYLALITRFYVASRFLGGYDKYLEVYRGYAIFYTGCCVIVFALFNLYRINTKYAGYNDFNNIFYANIITLLLHFTGTIFGERRMPLSFYIIQAFFQFTMVVVVRFAHRIYIAEMEHLTRHNKSKPNVLIVGANETGKMVIKHIAHEKKMQPVCVLNINKKDMSGLFDGLPIENGVDSLEDIIEKRMIDCIVIADDLKEEDRNAIYDKSNEKKILVQDFVSLTIHKNQDINLKDIQEIVNGKIEITLDSDCILFESLDSAEEFKNDKYIIKSLSVHDDVLAVELELKEDKHYRLDAEWARKQEEETGETISFF